jgi:hypothetical protein
MRKNYSIVGIIGLCSLLAVGGCDCCAADDYRPAIADSFADADAHAVSGYTFVYIDGAPEANPDCSTGSAGADIDVIAVYDSKRALKGVGKTVVHKEGASPKCPKWGKTSQCSYGTIKPECHNDPNDVAGGLNTKMYGDATPDTGYFGLSGGTVEVTIGACSVSTDDVKSCDGKGPAVQIMAGDEIDVYEVDGTYKKVGTGPAAGIAPESCTCVAEAYEVWVSKKAGEGLVGLGKYTGSKGRIKVQ